MAAAATRRRCGGGGGRERRVSARGGTIAHDLFQGSVSACGRARNDGGDDDGGDNDGSGWG